VQYARQRDPRHSELTGRLGDCQPEGAAEERLRTLARKGAIELLPGTSRGIRLLARAASAAGLSVVGVWRIGQLPPGYVQ
jgi:repressor LexA